MKCYSKGVGIGVKANGSLFYATAIILLQHVFIKCHLSIAKTLKSLISIYPSTQEVLANKIEFYIDFFLFVIQITSCFHYEVAHTMWDNSRIAITSQLTYGREVISFWMTLNQIVLDIDTLTDGENKKIRHESFWASSSLHNKLNLLQSFFFINRFLYWRVCCYVCTREPKKNKRRQQMIRRETYRQQQQLALQDRPP